MRLWRAFQKAARARALAGFADRLEAMAERAIVREEQHADDHARRNNGSRRSDVPFHPDYEVVVNNTAVIAKMLDIAALARRLA